MRRAASNSSWHAFESLVDLGRAGVAVEHKLGQYVAFQKPQRERRESATATTTLARHEHNYEQTKCGQYAAQ